jgi:uncharacterized protein
MHAFHNQSIQKTARIHTMQTTALYAALLVPIFILLSVRVIRTRRGRKIAIGDGQDQQMLRAMRVHANFAEYVPMSLLMMTLAESTGTPTILIHAAGIALIVGRLAHAFGVSQTPENFKFRVTGMALTFTVLVVLAAACLYQQMA